VLFIFRVRFKVDLSLSYERMERCRSGLCVHPYVTQEGRHARKELEAEINKLKASARQK
jgi:hypothetical protein